MRNAIVCLLLGLTAFDCAAVPVHRPRKKNSRLKTFTDRYALPTGVDAIKARLPLTFGYRFTDDYGTVQSREEKTDEDGSKTGSYSFVDPTGIYRRVEYVADHHGFRATVTTNEPGTLAVDPAHVRMLAENKNYGHGSFSHSIGTSPQLEYSNKIFSRYNISGEYGDGNYPGALTDIHGPFVPKSPLFESERLEIDNAKNLKNAFKESSLTFSPGIASLLHDLENSKPAVFGTKQNSEKFFDHPSIDSSFLFDDKNSAVGYAKKVPTRYPRHHRDSNTKKRAALKIHIPKGYEDNHHELPLYRDK